RHAPGYTDRIARLRNPALVRSDGLLLTIRHEQQVPAPVAATPRELAQLAGKGDPLSIRHVHVVDDLEQRALVVLGERSEHPADDIERRLTAVERQVLVRPDGPMLVRLFARPGCGLCL